MKYIKVDDKLKLSDLTNIVGSRNVEQVLNINKISRTPYIGKEFMLKCKDTISHSDPVTSNQKQSILNTLTESSDVFETACLLGSSGWKLLNSSQSTFPGYMKIPEEVQVPTSTDTLGNKLKVDNKTYNRVMQSLSDTGDILPDLIRPSEEINYILTRTFTQGTESRSSGALRYFQIPWGKVTLHSSLSDESVDFPCYPEEMSDIARANYGQMPDMLYQYEPWVVYNSSGPRTNTYKFNIHRDMWDDHNRGGANNLIRFCEANCYPNYRGSAVHSSIVTLYISGSPLIRGVVTEVSVDWSGPLGHDGFYLFFTLSLTIQEVASEPLNYDKVRSKSLIG